MRVSDIAGRRKIDLNVDIGEGFPFDAQLLQFASSANVCCGAHAGSLELTRETIELCKRKKIRIGTHPGYPDRPSMGRRSMESSEQRHWLTSIIEQVKSFTAMVKPAYLKPHGAFYNETAVILPEDWSDGLGMVSKSEAYQASGLYLAQFPGLQSLVLILRMHKIPLMGLESTAHRVVAERSESGFIREGFADRGYLPTGQLVPRGEPGALLDDKTRVRAQTLEVARRVDSICLHGDGERALEFAELVYSTLKDNGYEVGF